MTHPPQLPPGYHFLETLASRPEATVVLAELDGEKVVVRLEPAGTTGESRAELAVLAAVRHPGLARLLDHGRIGDSRFVTRSFVEGRMLSDVASERTPMELGALVQGLCPALEALHERGFLHGDLKAANVIVPPDGPPVLTDFGLSRALGHQGEGASGSYYGMAPEVLLGTAPDARADLFALGVMLHHLLVPATVDVREFYGRFPAMSFFEADGSDASQLPEWARDLIARLVERDPARRPSSATEVERALVARLDGKAGPARGSRAPRLDWSGAFGREEWCRAQFARLEGADFAPEIWTVGRDDDGDDFLDGAALLAAVEGRPVVRIDLEASASELTNSRTLDRWARRRAAEARGALVFVTRVGARAWNLRALEHLQRSLDPLAPPLAFIVHGDPVLLEELPRLAVPPVSEAGIGQFLESHFETDERLEILAERLHAESGGGSKALALQLEDIVASGWVLHGERGLRLGPGALPDWLGRTRGRHRSEAVDDLDPDVRLLLAAIHVAGGTPTLDHAAHIAGLQTQELAGVLERAAESGRVSTESGNAGSVVLKLKGRSVVRSADLTADEWSRLHSRQADWLEQAGAPDHRVLPHIWRAGPPADFADRAEALVRELRERGCPELALEFMSRIEGEARAADRALEPRLVLLEALVWATVGEAERAESLLDRVSIAESELESRAERIRGQNDLSLRRFDSALQHFERALALGADEYGDALLAKIWVLSETGNTAALEELVARADSGELGDLPRAALVNLRGFAAMGAFREGRVDAARKALESSLAEAKELDDPRHEAVVRTNLGTVARRAGDPREALVHFDRALELHESAGSQPGIAQVQSLRGGVLRETGELARAESALSNALHASERLGDAQSAAGARGLLGLLYAERGQARGAITELDRSALRLLEAGNAAHAALLEGRAGEMRARIGASDGTPELNADLARRDPRLFLSHARMIAMGGQVADGVELCRRALEQAEELGLIAVQDEARLTRALLTGETLEGLTMPAAQADSKLLGFLLADSLDDNEALGCAESLAEQGRDDRAARLFVALAARAADAHVRMTARRRAAECLELCSVALSPEERAAFQLTLLGVPDPRPDDFDRYQQTEDESEMDVLSLLEINHRLVEQQDIATLLGAIVEASLEVTGAERGFLALEDDGVISLDLALDSRRGDIDEPEVEVSHSIIRHALEVGESVRLSNASDDPVIGDAPSVSELHLRSILCEPFEVEPGLRGVIYLDNRVREGAFSERAERLLRLLSDQAALAIRQVRRLEDIRRLNNELGEEVVVKDSDLKAARRALVDAGVTVPVGGLVGDAPVMKNVHALLARVAPSDLPVLVCGASGTGKELAARALHDLGPRANGPFAPENCAALPESLIESELFGYKQGAFTGADNDRAGLFERASGGTLFLDEIGELPIDLQAKLLRVVETREVRRLGENEARPVDFRIVAATNRDLTQEVAAKRFRADLLYRLDGVRIEMPLLADRIADIPALVDHFLRLEEAKTGVHRTCDPLVMRRLCERDWPGNVRELANEVARLTVMSESDLVDPDLVRTSQVLPEIGTTSGAIRQLSELERSAILGALQRTQGDKARAAELLGISRAKIYQRLKEWREDEQE